MSKKVCLSALVALSVLSTACAGSDSDVSAESNDRRAAPAETTVAARAEQEAPADTAASTGLNDTQAPASESATATADVGLDPTAVAPPESPTFDQLSTFALDVDTGSYTLARSYLNSGVRPDPATVRTEEFVNAFDQGYPQPEDGPFLVSMDATTAPFLSAEQRILRIGVQGRNIGDSERRDANLTFVIDSSGSMNELGKIDLAKDALIGLIDELRPTDRVAIVQYSDTARIVLRSTPLSESEVVIDAIRSLETGGSTYAEGGLALGYAHARDSFQPDRTNRIILMSDGVANVGATGPEAILDTIGKGRTEGIDLVTVGVGMGTFNDTLMEQLANQGNGFYAYIDTIEEAERLFGEDLTSTLETIARDAKVQVSFNPSAVRSYRLLGYENRAIADEDFRDDRVDGGELGAGHQVTALYEITMVEGADPQGELATTTLRWQDPQSRQPFEIAVRLTPGQLWPTLGDSPLRLQQAIVVAAFAEHLRQGPWSNEISMRWLADSARSLGDRLGDQEVRDLAVVIDRAALYD